MDNQFFNFDNLPVTIENTPRAKENLSTITLEEHFALEIYKSFLAGRPTTIGYSEYSEYSEYIDHSDMTKAVEAANKLISVINGEELN